MSLENAGGLALQLGVVAPCRGSLGVHLTREPKAGLGWTGQAVRRGSYRRALGKERRVVVGVRRPLGQHGGGVGIILHAAGAVDAG